MKTLEGKKVAILSENGFEASELFKPYDRLTEEGATVKIVSSEMGEIQGMKGYEWTDKIAVDVKTKDADATDFDMLVIPGGLFNPDSLRVDQDALALIKAFDAAAKPIAAICHGPQPMIDAGIVEGKTMTAVEAIKTDLVNAGVNFVDKEVVQDGHIITSRVPEDIPAFNDKIVEVLSK